MRPANLRTIPGDGMFELIESYSYSVFTVPAGFKTDLCTIPRIFWSFIASDDKDMLEASIVHDFLYSKESDWLFNRKRCDIILTEAMEQLGASELKMNLVYLIVRALGWMWYKKS